jgi:hypothetical protein
MKRQHQLLLIGATLGLSWLAMQAVHELGHVGGAALSGGRIAEVVLHPATISYTRLAVNPHPLLVAWMGPLVGVAVPLAAWSLVRWGRIRGWYLAEFFAGFCLVANGAYLAGGALAGVGDAGDLVRHGTPIMLLWLFGLITISIGLWLWNGLGPYFGLGASRGSVDTAAAYVVSALFLATIVLELALA